MPDDDKNPIRIANPRKPSVKLKDDDIAVAFEPLAHLYPPILGLAQAAELAGLKPSTLKRKVSEGRFDGCVTKGKPLRFWRNGFVRRIFEAA